MLAGAEAVLAGLAGRWRLDRLIRERRAPSQRLRFVGAAVIAPAPCAPGRLLHVERGRLLLPSGAVTATRRYLWGADAGGLALLYDDGRPMVVFEIGDAGQGRRRARGGHDCAPDRYEAALRIGAPNGAAQDGAVEDGALQNGAAACWRLVWRILGPRKHTWILSRFERD